MINLKYSTENSNKHRFWHKMKLIEDTGITQYYECKKCQTRQIIQQSGGCQLINYKWLRFETDKIQRS